jgi:hypothetical protein
MYSKQEASQLRQEFWTTLGRYMSPVLSAEGEKVNWINYKTGEKSTFFRLHADNKQAFIALEFAQRDTAIQELYFQQLQQLRILFEEEAGSDWTWQLHHCDDQGQVVSRVVAFLEDVSVFRKEDWPQMISFFKPRLIALEAFWSQARYAFEALRG